MTGRWLRTTRPGRWGVPGGRGPWAGPGRIWGSTRGPGPQVEPGPLWTEGTAAEYARFTVPKDPSYALVAGIDGIHLLHRDFGRLLDPADARRPDLTGPKALGALSDSPAHMIVDRGRPVGLWEFDTEAQEIVRQPWVPRDAELRAAVASAEACVRDQLGDARSFSLDSPKSRAPRIAALRAGR
ncbi:MULTISPECIES: hypothetical protein [unclassified Streptomyces]|uniref:hypothetical protein n=1 Tax=unclassified Streptomyces TaxID=2593676 RepID=UPI001944A450|nr:MULTISPECIES: hypothetical protein [unclassified Streptomyces]